jgi:hypothetical protein
MAIIRGLPQGLLNNIIGAAPNNAVGTTPQQAVAAPVQAPPPPLDINALERFTAPDGFQYLQDPNTKNVFQLIRTPDPFTYDIHDPKEPTFQESIGKLVDINDLVENPEYENLRNGYNYRGLNNPGEKYYDPVYAANLTKLKKENPDQYYKTLATDISDQIVANWSMNKSEHNVAFNNQLESIKEKNPAAYYQAQLNLLSKQIGWQHGQNTFERAAGAQEKIKSLLPDAIKAGVTPEQIDAIYGAGFSSSSMQNQEYIANRAASGGGGFNLGELVRGVLPVAALAIGGPLLDAALAAGTAAGAAGGTAAGTGLTGGVGGSTGFLIGPGATGLSGAGSAAGIAGTQAAAGLGIAGGSALPAAGMAVGALPSTVGSLSAALPAQGSLGGAGLLSAELAPGTILGSGLPGGGAIGGSYALGANGMPALNLLGQPIPASSVGFGSIPNTVTSGLSISINDALNAARIGRGLLGGQKQPTPQGAAPRPQSIMPQGQVDYSGILNLLQVPSPQRNMYSLLG